mmetsp:Transcript_53383/g.127703  ORF Transcript_53383/g.127703 Transcript_53383/m.127703 type:complete len:196 (-) Transcript_53383:3348-3935(-)
MHLLLHYTEMALAWPGSESFQMHLENGLLAPPLDIRFPGQLFPSSLKPNRGGLSLPNIQSSKKGYLPHLLATKLHQFHVPPKAQRLQSCLCAFFVGGGKASSSARRSLLRAAWQFLRCSRAEAFAALPLSNHGMPLQENVLQTPRAGGNIQSIRQCAPRAAVVQRMQLPRKTGKLQFFDLLRMPPHCFHPHKVGS